MGVIKKPFLKKSNRQVTEAEDETKPELIDEVAEDAESSSTFEGAQEPRRHIGIGLHTKSAIHVPSEKRIRLSADIQKPLHKRLKRFAIEADKSILAILEDWIQDYTPE